MEFGKHGEILVALINTEGKIIYRSPVTGEEYPSNNKHILRYRSGNIEQHIPTKNITKDQTNSRYVGYCPKCKKERIIAWAQNTNMVRICKCLSCESII